ncbi:hypothetical protein KY334_01755 [Candidatus Woesearchaeota archaeon]|nr:hypothetical protein [Candidatus Woesearchaeota archaeon]
MTENEVLNNELSGFRDADTDDELITLGGNIQLSGFRGLKKINNVVINKIIGNNVKKIRDSCDNFEMLNLRLRDLSGGKQKKVELHAKAVDNGTVFTSELVDRNLYFALDSILRKIRAEIDHRKAKV